MAVNGVGETTPLHNLLGLVTYITSLRYKEKKRGLHVPVNIPVSGFASNYIEWFAGFILIAGRLQSQCHIGGTRVVQASLQQPTVAKIALTIIETQPAAC